MRCKKHPTDQSGVVGVCGTCLRERLLVLIAAQARQESDPTRHESDPARKIEAKPPQLLFPRSVSPYLSHRKSDTSLATWHHIRGYHSLPDPKFFSTPQIGPTGSIIVDQNKKKKKSGKFGIFSKLFRSKSDKPVADSVPKAPEPRESSTVTSSPAWFPNILARRKQARTFSIDYSAIRRLRQDHRGMSPAMGSDDEMDPNYHPSDDEPRRTPAATRRRHGGGGGGGRSTQLNRNVSGISICLSPMVRASPSQSWKYNGGAPPETAVSGEIRMPIKSHSITASFCKNRSRKLADIGRSSHNR